MSVSDVICGPVRGLQIWHYSIPYLLVEVMGMDKLPEREKGTYFLINHFAF